MDNKELADRLFAQKITIKNMAYALSLACPQSTCDISNDAHCICAWIDDACEALRKEPSIG